MRLLSAEEKALWDRVAATIRPLSRQLVQPDEADPQADLQIRPAPAAGTRVAITAAPARPRPGTTLDGSWDKRLRDGKAAPDRVLDLHGHSLDRAWRAIDDALERSIDTGDRLLLLVTGHERPGEPPIERGKIRAAVHDWLSVSRHAPRIAAVRAAHRRHGGGGSLYIILRRG